MANQFYVSPLGGANPLQGLGMIAQGLDRRKEEEEKQAQQMRMQELGAEATRLYREGTPEQIAEFSIQNPEIGQLLDKQIGFKNEATKENMRQGMEEILLGSNPEKVLTERIQMVEAQGGDATQTRSELAAYKANPEGYVDTIERVYSVKFPEQYNAYAKTKPKGADFQYKDGLVFNPATGDVERTEYYQEPGGGAVEFTNLRTDEKGVTTGYNKATGRIEVVPTQQGVTRGVATPQTVVNLGGEGLTEEQKALAKQRVNRYGKITEAAEAATQEIDSINQIRSIDLDTGFGTELKANAARVIDALGGDGEAIAGVNVDDVDKFNSVAERQVLNIMATQKGPQTDQDAARIKKTVAGTETTKEANAFILDSMEAISNRKIEQQEFWDSYLEDNDGSLKGVQSAWNKYKKSTPMVSEVVKNPATGKPMFYYQFRESFRGRGYPDDEIIESWRKLTGGK